MGNQAKVLAGAAMFAAVLAVGPAGAVSTLDGWPSRTVYVSNDAPFVVFGVTPTQLDHRAAQLQLSFVATDRLDLVNIFVFYRDRPDGPVQMRSQVACGPRERGSWDCAVPVAQLLAELAGMPGELGLRIEAHGDLRQPRDHSTVIVTVPVGPGERVASRRSRLSAPRHAPAF
jgi:hypothetical protein